MSQIFKIFFVLILYLLMSGCYYFQMPTDKDFACLYDEAKVRTNSDVFLDPPALDYEENILNIVHTGLSRNQAVELALSNNKGLLAKLEELGISKSEYLQASLLTNPTFASVVRYPKIASDCFNNEIEKLSDREAYTDIEVRFQLSDLWLLPLRQRVAFDDVRITFFDLISQAIDTMYLARREYDRVMLNEARIAVFKELLDFAREMQGYFNWRLKYAKTVHVHHSPVYNYHANIEFLERKAQHFLYKGNLQAAYARLKEALGLYHIDNKRIENSNKLDNICFELLPIEDLINLAYKYNPDLQKSRVYIQKYYDLLKYEQASIFKDVRLGVSTEKGIDPLNPLQTGPALDFEIPFFDYNQAQVSKALYLLEKAKREYIALQLDIKSKIYDYHSWIKYLIKDITLRRNELVPNAIKIRRYAEKYYKTNKVTSEAILQGYVSVRRAKQDYLDHFELILDYYEGLERIIGKRLDLEFDCFKHSLIENITPDTYKFKGID